MKFTCEKYLLHSAILTASRAASTKSPIVLLEGLLIEADDETIKITGFDLKTAIVTTIPAEIEQSGGVVLNAKLFTEIIRKMPGQTVNISVNPNYTAVIKSEMSVIDILGFSTSDYPELPTIDGEDTFQIGESTIKKMISQTNFAVSDNESKPIHMGSKFETRGGELTIVALDGFRLALRKELMDVPKSPELDFVVPGTALSELEKIASDGDEIVTVTLGSKHIMFSINDTTLISRRLEGEFLNYKHSIPQNPKYKIIVNKYEFIAAVERVALIISDNLKSPIRCLIADGLIKLSSMSTLGKAVDECNYEGTAEELEIGFNDKYLLDALKAAPAETLKLELNSGVNPCIIIPADDKDNFLYMVLPVRLKNYES
jgi:DNA polymerase-3 subunit beta